MNTDGHGRKKVEEQLPQRLKPLAIEQYFAAGLKPGPDKASGVGGIARAGYLRFERRHV